MSSCRLAPKGTEIQEETRAEPTAQRRNNARQNATDEHITSTIPTADFSSPKLPFGLRVPLWVARDVQNQMQVSTNQASNGSYVESEIKFWHRYQQTSRNKENLKKLATTVENVVSFAHTEVSKASKDGEEARKEFDEHFAELLKCVLYTLRFLRMTIDHCLERLLEAVESLIRVHRARGRVSAFLWSRKDLRKAEGFCASLRTWRVEFIVSTIASGRSRPTRYWCELAAWNRVMLFD